jgi:tetratricopeptide (TPR) repeat protein
LAERDLEVNPRDTDALGQLALYEAKSGNLKKARLLIGQALTIAPEDPDVLSEAVEVFALTGEQQKALDYLKNALQSGYPRFEVEANPELAGLRSDLRYREMTNPPHRRRCIWFLRKQLSDRRISLLDLRARRYPVVLSPFCPHGSFAGRNSASHLCCTQRIGPRPEKVET